ncbi:RCC1 repeat domain-containing protein [Streptomyces sp. H28]|uniref:RCC1 domain-containing protein n=1 Tax=Streptomyces sp. H28 TaxID=2775865 RepID=UPI00177C0156|nr:RCC1 repeat domain-containing protein [Streptomyces sp. H28]MBD9734054.1 RCC1 repeat domain-containing protein [Streptomyces sp. H28]
MRRGVWLRTLVAGIVMLGAAGCGSEGDRAVMAAPACPDGPSGRPQPARVPPGAVWAGGPHTTAPADAWGGGMVPGWTDVVSVSDSGFSTAAVRADGTVWTYGVNYKGSLGHGSQARDHLAEPRRVAGITDARSVHHGGSTFFVVRADGSVLAWGSENILVNAGRRDGYAGVTRPRPVPRAGGVVSMGPDSLTAFALRSDGRVLGWGVNLTDVLGNTNSTRLTRVKGVSNAVGLASTGSAVVVATADGRVCAWGSNAHGVLGITPRGGQSGRPVQVRGLKDIVQVAGGHHVAYALDRDGTVWAWGRGVSGTLGDGVTAEHHTARPVKVPGLPAVRRISAHQFTGYAIDTDGGLWSWGSGVTLGDHTRATGAAPERVPLPGPALDVSARHVIVDTGR